VSQSTLILIVLSLFLGLGAWLVFVWAARTGEFDDVEGPKHRMLEEDPEERQGAEHPEEMP
jgi:cbb3-type cytochrome oxidase maturation protein